MKVLLDSCVWGGALDEILAAGHDVVWTGAWEPDPGDTAILAFAHAQGRVLFTLDKDFGELVILKGAPHAGIVRLVRIRARDQGADRCADPRGVWRRSCLESDSHRRTGPCSHPASRATGGFEPR